MTSPIKHITVRNGVFQYHRRVPQEVIDRPIEFGRFFGGQKLFRRSLKTKDQGEALARAARAAREFQSKVDMALGHRSASVTTPQATRPVTAELLRKISETQRDSVTKPFRLQVVWREADFDEHNDELERMVERFEQDAEHISDVLRKFASTKDPSLDIPAIAGEIIERGRINAPKDSAERALIQTAIRDGLLAGHNEIAALASGDKSALPSPTKRSTSSAPMLSETVDYYASRLTKRRTCIEVKAALSDFLSLHGDLPLDELKKVHFLRFCEVQGGKQVGGKSRGSVMRPVSQATLGKKVGLLRAAINQAIKRGVFEGSNPAAGIDPSAFTQTPSAAAMPSKRPFNIDELNLIFQYPWFSGCHSSKRIHLSGEHWLGGMHYWVPILALFTGCRAGELGGLMVEEVRINDRHPHILIRDNQFRTTKGAYRRKIPILDQLMELGFARFVEQAGAKSQIRLFDEWKPPSGRLDTDDPAWSNGSIIRSFNQTLIPKVLSDILMPGARREVTFHSFRGAFKTMLGLARYGLPPNYIHEVVGHKKFALDKRYVKEIPIEETYPATRNCRFEGLRLPRFG